MSIATTAVSFAAGPRLEVREPPSKPPPYPGLGTPCFKATVHLYDVHKRPIGKFVGYSSTVEVCKATESACKNKTQILDGDYSCSVADLVMLRSMRAKECVGNYYFELDEK